MRAGILSMVVLLLSATDGLANVSGHSNPKVSPIPGGFQLKLRLTNHSGYATARVGLIPRSKATKTLTRLQAVVKSEGVLLHQFPTVTGIKPSEVREVAWKVKYKGSGVKPGQLLSIVSGWGQTGTETSPHVFGGVTQAAEAASSFIKLPAPKRGK